MTSETRYVKFPDSLEIEVNDLIKARSYDVFLFVLEVILATAFFYER